MQGQESQGPKVVSIFSKKNAEEKESRATETNEQPTSFSDVMRQNQKNKERLEKERASANKSVLRSYRIKH
jgi:hypothetical protein